MNENEVKKLGALGFGLDTDQVWRREEMVVLGDRTATLRFTLQQDRGAWDLVLDLVDAADPDNPAELTRLRLAQLDVLLDAIAQGAPSAAIGAARPLRHENPAYTLQPEGGDPRPIDLDAFLAASEIDPEQLSGISALRPGESIRLGEGTLKREA